MNEKIKKVLISFHEKGVADDGFRRKIIFLAV